MDLLAWSSVLGFRFAAIDASGISLSSKTQLKDFYPTMLDIEMKFRCAVNSEREFTG